jgi:hypothetical protein
MTRMVETGVPDSHRKNIAAITGEKSTAPTKPTRASPKATQVERGIPAQPLRWNSAIPPQPDKFKGSDAD